MENLNPGYPGKRAPLPEEIDAITQTYLKTLTIPSRKIHNNFFICPIGDMGSGKSTVLKLLGDYLSFIRIASDDVRKMLFDKGFLPTLAVDISWKIISDFAKSGYSLALDQNCLSFAVGGRKSEFEKLVEVTKARVFWIHVNPPKEYIIAKLTSLDKKLGSAPWLFKNGAPGVERYVAKRMDKKILRGIPFAYTFDTSKDYLQPQIRQAVRIMRARLGGDS